jgi:DNA-binding HxlR family transcriptional regulator
MTAQVVTTKWTPLVIRELLTSAPMRFSELRKGVPRMSQSLLTRRLEELEFSGILTKTPLKSGGYEYDLTTAGEALRPLIELMGLWGRRHLMHQMTEKDLDPNLLFWDMRRGVDAKVYAQNRQFVAQFEVSGVKPKERMWWVICNEAETDVCARNPGHDIDLFVHAPIRSLVEIWVGTAELEEELRSGRLRLKGDKKDCDLFPQWFKLSPFANERTQKRLSVA